MAAMQPSKPGCSALTIAIGTLLENSEKRPVHHLFLPTQEPWAPLVLLPILQCNYLPNTNSLNHVPIKYVQPKHVHIESKVNLVFLLDEVSVVQKLYVRPQKG